MNWSTVVTVLVLVAASNADESTCNSCRLGFSTMQPLFQIFKDPVVATVTAPCTPINVDILRAQCIRVLGGLVNLTFAEVSPENMQPVEFCRMIKACPKETSFSSLAEAIPKADLCSRFDTFYSATSSEHLNDYCNELEEGSFRDKCSSVVRLYNEYVESTVRNGVLEGAEKQGCDPGALQANHAKGLVRLRRQAPDDEDKPLCRTCLGLANFIKDNIINDTLKEKVMKQLTGFCDKLGKNNKSCIDGVKKFATELFNILNSYAKADVVCAMIKACKEKPKPSE
jgi:hypothetical protein